MVFAFELEQNGILNVRTSGFWELAEAKAYIAELKARVEALRHDRSCALVLVDGRESKIQSLPVMEAVGDIQSILIVGAQDRAVYVVDNSLSKLQAQRLATSDQLKVFLSPSAARTWLLAYQANC